MVGVSRWPEVWTPASTIERMYLPPPDNIGDVIRPLSRGYHVCRQCVSLDSIPGHEIECQPFRMVRIRHRSNCTITTNISDPVFWAVVIRSRSDVWLNRP